MADPQRERLLKWLQSPECREYRDYLRAIGAAAIAEAGNLMLSEDEVDTAEAKDLFKAAREVLAAENAIAKMSASDYKFLSIEIKPSPCVMPETAPPT